MREGYNRCVTASSLAKLLCGLEEDETERRSRRRLSLSRSHRLWVIQSTHSTYVCRFERGAISPSLVLLHSLLTIHNMMMKSLLVLVAFFAVSAVAFVPSYRLAEASRSFAASRSSSRLRMSTERTYIMIKPDGVQRGLIGNIIGRFETKGYHLVALKTKQASGEILDQHYKDLVDKPFFPKLKNYMLSGPVVCMVWEGREAVATGRLMLVSGENEYQIVESYFV